VGRILLVISDMVADVDNADGDHIEVKTSAILRLRAANWT
jgi:hypothetical protein